MCVCVLRVFLMCVCIKCECVDVCVCVLSVFSMCVCIEYIFNVCVY